MNKRALIVAFIAPLLMAGQCDPKQINVREACEVLNKTLYRGGTFSLTDAEIDALREVNQNKIIAIKNFYRDKCLSKG